MKPIFRNLTALTAVAALAACSNLGGNAGNNQTRAKFLNEVWVGPELKGKAASEVFANVYFAPTTCSHLKDQGWWNSQGTKTKEQLETDAHNLARHFHHALVAESTIYPGKRIHVVSSPGAHTLIVETAITELVPAKAFWNAAATAAGFAVPGAGMLSMAGKGVIGIEGRLRDGNTGAVIGEFRHRMTDQSAVVDVASYKWYGGSEANLTQVAKKTAEVLNAPSDKVVNASLPIKLVAF